MLSYIDINHCFITCLKMINLSISAKFLKSHLLELKSSDGFQENKITRFGLFNDYFFEFTPVSLENRYYQDRNIWVVCIISTKNSISIDNIDNAKDIEPGFDFDQVLTFLGNNLDKPVYFYARNTFYPIYKTDIVKWNGLLGVLNGLPNHLKESTDDIPLEGIDALIKQAKYRVSIDKFQTENGLSDRCDMYKEPNYYYFSNLISAKLFYNKVVASFMDSTPSDYKTNFDQFSTNSLSWRGIRTFKDFRFGDSVIIGDNLFIEIRSIKISYDWIEGEFDLI